MSTASIIQPYPSNNNPPRLTTSASSSRIRHRIVYRRAQPSQPTPLSITPGMVNRQCIGLPSPPSYQQWYPVSLTPPISRLSPTLSYPSMGAQQQRQTLDKTSSRRRRKSPLSTKCSTSFNRQCAATWKEEELSWPSDESYSPSSSYNAVRSNRPARKRPSTVLETTRDALSDKPNRTTRVKRMKHEPVTSIKSRTNSRKGVPDDDSSSISRFVNRKSNSKKRAQRKSFNEDVRRERSRKAAQVRRNGESQALLLAQNALPIHSRILGLTGPSTNSSMTVDSTTLVESRRESFNMSTFDISTFSSTSTTGVNMEKSDVLRIAGHALFLLNHLHEYLKPSTIDNNASPTKGDQYCATDFSSPSSLTLSSRSLFGLLVDLVDDRVVYTTPALTNLIGCDWPLFLRSNSPSSSANHNKLADVQYTVDFESCTPCSLQRLRHASNCSSSTFSSSITMTSAKVVKASTLHIATAPSNSLSDFSDYIELLANNKNVDGYSDRCQLTLSLPNLTIEQCHGSPLLCFQQSNSDDLSQLTFIDMIHLEDLACIVELINKCLLTSSIQFTPLYRVKKTRVDASADGNSVTTTTTRWIRSIFMPPPPHLQSSPGVFLHSWHFAAGTSSQTIIPSTLEPTSAKTNEQQSALPSSSTQSSSPPPTSVIPSLVQPTSAPAVCRPVRFIPLINASASPSSCTSSDSSSSPSSTGSLRLRLPSGCILPCPSQPFKLHVRKTSCPATLFESGST